MGSCSWSVTACVYMTSVNPGDVTTLPVCGGVRSRVSGMYSSVASVVSTFKLFGYTQMNIRGHHLAGGVRGRVSGMYSSVASVSAFLNLSGYTRMNTRKYSAVKGI